MSVTGSYGQEVKEVTGKLFSNRMMSLEEAG
jgi:hypothetical protein